MKYDMMMITHDTDTLDGYTTTIGDKTVFKYYAFRDDQPLTISREMLDEMSKLNTHVMLVTNAGVDIHSSENNKYKNVRIVRETYDVLSKEFNNS